jgi:poly(3-hydroxybutyrate) depolymerase
MASIGEDRVKSLVLMLTTALTAGGTPLVDAAEQLKSGAYYITQSWSQETAFKRPYYVSVPESTDQRKFPVFIFLHGHGGNAKEAMHEFMRRHTTMAGRYVMVFPNGYKTGWNIMSEHSKADDLGFIEAIVEKLSTYDNIQTDNFSVMGNSNGAALVNQLAIESKLPDLRNYVSAVSPLNVYQHDGKNFKAKGADNNYQGVATPMTGKRLMNISGTTDDLVPYRGGPSKYIPAKDGTLGFVDAEESIFLWAKQMGYDGEKLSNPSRSDGNLEIFSYLNGDVIHYKVINEGHGASRAISEKILLEFLEGGDEREK